MSLSFKRLFFTLFSLVLLWGGIVSYGAVRVGIKNTDMMLNVISEGQLNVVLTEEEEIVLESSEKRWSFFSDGYYSKEKKTDYLNAEIGPYHLRIAEEFSSYEEAKEYLDEENLRDGWVHYGGRGEFFILVGRYVDENQRDYQREHLEEDGFSVEEYQETIYFLSTEDILLSYGEKYPLRLQNFDTLVLHYLGGVYRGGVYGITSGSQFLAINFLEEDDYLKGVLPAEIYASWPMEAIKAQAVVARTYLRYQMIQNQNAKYDISNDTSGQVYKGFTAETENTNKGVSETEGEILKYKGIPIMAVYHSNSGGKTESSQNIWTSALPYLQGKEDPYSLNQQRSTWQYTISKQELTAILEKHYSLGNITGLRIIEKSENGRVLKLEVIGTSNRVILEKELLRKLLGYDKIKSIWYDFDAIFQFVIQQVSGQEHYTNASVNFHVITEDSVEEIATRELYIRTDNGTFKHSNTAVNAGDDIVFNGRGFGHGVGLSQWGAKAMADQGFDYKEICLFYYTGTEVGEDY